MRHFPIARGPSVREQEYSRKALAVRDMKQILVSMESDGLVKDALY